MAANAKDGLEHSWCGKRDQETDIKTWPFRRRIYHKLPPESWVAVEEFRFEPQ